MRARIFFIFILLLSGISIYGNDSLDFLNDKSLRDDPVAFVRKAHKAYKDVRKDMEAGGSRSEYAQYLESKRREDIDAASICVDCPNLLLLTENVNDILQHVKDDPRSEYPAHVLNELDSLEGMFYFIQEEDRQGLALVDGSPCSREELDYNNFFRNDNNFNEQNHVVLFTKNISFKDISQTQFIQKGKRKTFFFKAAYPNEDIIVKVVRLSSGVATVSYYRHKEIVMKALSDKERKERDYQKVGEPTKEDKQDDAIIFGGVSNGKKDELKIDYGWKTEGDSFIPKKVTVLEVEGISEFSEANLSGGVEVSSKRQAIDMKVSGKEGKSFVGVELNADTELKLKSRSDFDSFSITSQAKVKGTSQSAKVQLRDSENHEILELSKGSDGLGRVGVPHRFNVYDTGVIVDGRVVVGQDGSYGGTWVLSDRDTKKRYLDVGLKRNSESSGVSLGHSRSLSQNSRISIKVSHDEFDKRRESAGWVQFSMDF